MIEEQKMRSPSGSVILEIRDAGDSDKPAGLHCVWWGPTPDASKVPRKVVVWRFIGSVPSAAKMVKANPAIYSPIDGSDHATRRQQAIANWKTFEASHGSFPDAKALEFHKDGQDELKKIPDFSPR